MKKIMFNDKYGLTDAVLSGRKTMTRRIIPLSRPLSPVYTIGEEIAIAQSYHMLNKSGFVAPERLDHTLVCSAGYKNKMFVCADLMPHHIRITDIKAERLQDISEEDCLREGLLAGKQEPKMYGFKLPKGTVLSFMTPRDAFALLIDRISGKGTWRRNPWVFAYTFELVR